MESCHGDTELARDHGRTMHEDCKSASLCERLMSSEYGETYQSVRRILPCGVPSWQSASSGYSSRTSPSPSVEAPSCPQSAGELVSCPTKLLPSSSLPRSPPCPSLSTPPTGILPNARTRCPLVLGASLAHFPAGLGPGDRCFVSAEEHTSGSSSNIGPAEKPLKAFCCLHPGLTSS
jgi:hypothetical protein